ncbi:CoA transferase [Paracoccaceae bacterium]|nr:CoA transferase [Paracoccaceae bacterium]
MNPLKDLLVISIEQAVAAPFCTMRLVESGARVIKIERKDGDFARNYDQIESKDSSYFIWLNQGKESLVLDLKNKNDKKLLNKLFEKADVFVLNLAPGSLKKLELKPDDLAKKFPNLIICNISGFSNKTTIYEEKSYDLLIQAEAGIIGVSGVIGSPGRIGISIVDIGTGMTAHAAILNALLKRNMTGKGEVLNISMFDVAAEWMTVPFLQSNYSGIDTKPAGLRHPTIAPYGAHTTKDEKTIIIAVQNEREWERFCEVILSDKKITKHPHFCDNVQRVKNRSRLEKKIDKAVSNLNSKEFKLKLKQAQIAFAQVRNTSDLNLHEGFRTRQLVGSNGKTVSAPVSAFEQSSDDLHHKAPILGEHSILIKKEFLED